MLGASFRPAQLAVPAVVRPNVPDVAGGGESPRVMKKLRILFLVTEDWYFYSHRLPLARAARDAGCEVFVATRVRDHGERIRREGFELVPFEFNRSGVNPVSEYRSVRALVALYKRLRPDLVHHVSLKPVLYGTWAARRSGVPAVVNAVTGLGYVFTSSDWKARALRLPLQLALTRLLNAPNQRAFVQNPDDLRALSNAAGLPAERISLIRGSGVDTAEFAPRPEPDGVPRVVMVSRMLWPKGVGDFVEAARIVRGRGVPAKFVLVGRPDQGNPESISEEQLRAWDREGVVEWSGHREDIPGVWAASHIAMLPSYYGEGIPKSLLEAAACGRPAVTTDAPGCREAVQDGENGFLVPARSPAALAEALLKLIGDPELRRRMGAAGRRRAEELFSEGLAIRQTLGLYRELLGARWPG